jgi:hypothetical protein
MQGSRLSVTGRPHTVARDRRTSARPLLWMLVPGLLAGSLAAARAPLPRGLDGMTLCFPIVGPITRIDSTLRGRARTLAEIHERAHAARCRELGAVRSYAASLTIEGKLRSEANAFCAEAHFDLALGYPRENVLARIADELETAYGWTAGRSRGEIVAAIGAACPPLSARGRAGD